MRPGTSPDRELGTPRGGVERLREVHVAQSRRQSWGSRRASAGRRREVGLGPVQERADSCSSNGIGAGHRLPPETIMRCLTLAADQWRPRAEALERRADALTAGHRERSRLAARGTPSTTSCTTTTPPGPRCCGAGTQAWASRSRMRPNTPAGAGTGPTLGSRRSTPPPSGRRGARRSTL